MPTIPKIIDIEFKDATDDNPSSIINNTTGEIVDSEKKEGDLLRIKDEHIVFQPDNFVAGWTVGDVLTISIGGAKATSTNITLTAASNKPQTASVTAVAVSTVVLTI